jgi:hypothetical protein
MNMKINEVRNGKINLDIDEKDFNFIRRCIGGYMINTPKEAYATYSGYVREEILEFTRNMNSEAEKFSIEI